jgi:hypothetical protein
VAGNRWKLVVPFQRTIISKGENNAFGKLDGKLVKENNPSHADECLCLKLQYISD